MAWDPPTDASGAPDLKAPAVQWTPKTPEAILGLKVVDPATFLPVDDNFRGPARVLIAAQVGSTRLIDNDAIYLN
mgnify:CR=1 FL=1